MTNIRKTALACPRDPQDQVEDEMEVLEDSDKDERETSRARESEPSITGYV